MASVASGCRGKASPLKVLCFVSTDTWKKLFTWWQRLQGHLSPCFSFFDGFLLLFGLTQGPRGSLEIARRKLFRYEMMRVSLTYDILLSKWNKEISPPQRETSCNQTEWPGRKRVSNKVLQSRTSHLFPVIRIVVLFDLTRAKLLLEGGLCWGIQHFLPVKLLVFGRNTILNLPSGRIVWGPGYQCPVKGLWCISFVQPKENIARLVILKIYMFLTPWLVRLILINLTYFHLQTFPY